MMTGKRVDEPAGASAGTTGRKTLARRLAPSRIGTATSLSSCIS
jgi:hypothetical protein